MVRYKEVNLYITPCVYYGEVFFLSLALSIPFSFNSELDILTSRHYCLVIFQTVASRVFDLTIYLWQDLPTNYKNTWNIFNSKQILSGHVKIHKFKS